MLEDENRQRVKAIAQEYMNKAEEINKEILEQWITGRGKQPVTWKTLTEVLRDIELNTLAGEIEAVKCHEEEAIEDVQVGFSDNPVQRDPTNLLTGKTAEDSEQRSTTGVPTTGMEYKLRVQEVKWTNPQTLSHPSQLGNTLKLCFKSC